jgi:hypothetical protein
MEEWGDKYNQEGINKSRVAKTEIDQYLISTVFLGIDHNFRDSPRPILFETMIFGDEPGDGYQTRCSTWEEAQEMHKVAIQYVLDGCKDDD